MSRVRKLVRECRAGQSLRRLVPESAWHQNARPSIGKNLGFLGGRTPVVPASPQPTAMRVPEDSVPSPPYATQTIPTSRATPAASTTGPYFCRLPPLPQLAEARSPATAATTKPEGFARHTTRYMPQTAAPAHEPAAVSGTPPTSQS